MIPNPDFKVQPHPTSHGSGTAPPHPTWVRYSPTPPHMGQVQPHPTPHGSGTAPPHPTWVRYSPTPPHPTWVRYSPTWVRSLLTKTASCHMIMCCVTGSVRSCPPPPLYCRESGNRSRLTTRTTRAPGSTPRYPTLITSPMNSCTGSRKWNMLDLIYGRQVY